MKLFLKLIIVFILFLFPFLIQAQTPIANRVKAMAKHLPEGANVIAKYTDTMSLKIRVKMSSSHHRDMPVCSILLSVPKVILSLL